MAEAFARMSNRTGSLYTWTCCAITGLPTYTIINIAKMAIPTCLIMGRPVRERAERKTRQYRAE